MPRRLATWHAPFALLCMFCGACSVLSASGLNAADLPAAERRVWRLDTGPENTGVRDSMLRLGPADLYDPGKGYGWKQSPNDAFVRQELARSRDAAIRDGVAGEHLELKVDASPGAWRIVLWLDIRDRSARPPRVAVNGQPVPVVWPNFKPQAEPVTTPSKLYSVTFASATAAERGLTLKLSASEGDVVRLLCLTLLREVSAELPAQKHLREQITAAGRYSSDVDLEKLAGDLRTAAVKTPNNGWAVYWRTRLEMLVQAEQLYAMAGWQRARDTTGLGMFDRLFLAGLLLDGLLGEKIEPTDPLAERAAALRGRLFYWLAKQRGGQRETQRSMDDLGFLLQRYPNDPLLAMYAGQRIDTPDPCDLLRPTPGAPAWSNAQREALCRLRQTAHWWVEQRQSDTGEFGGKWGDDVELLRWWAPLAVLGDEVALRGWQKLADGVWNSRYVSGGYAARVSDVEHAAEYVADTLSLLSVCTDDPVYVERLRPSLSLFRNLWTDVTPRGNRHFRSTWFSSTEVDATPPRGRDVEYNTRAVQPIRYLAWRTGDRDAIESLHEWSLAWRLAALRTDKQKPRGIMPASIRFPDESINGDGANWYEADMAWPYYQWEHHCGTLLLDQLLFAYTQTGDRALLEPLRLSLQLVESLDDENLAKDALREAVSGSPAWAAERLRQSRRFWSVAEQYRLATGDDHWDELIANYGTSYGRYRVTGDEHHLVTGLTDVLEHLRYNTPLMTTEALHTDRVYVSGSELIKAMLTGDLAIDNTSPYYAVTWEQTDPHFTALVREAQTDHLVLDIYSHATEQRTVAMRLWQLAPGAYLLRQKAAAGRPVKEPKVVHVAARGDRHLIQVPSQQLVTLSMEPLELP